MGAYKGPTTEEMDEEWEAILAGDDEDDDDDEDENDEDFERDEKEEEEEEGGNAMMSDAELLATDASEGGDLDAPSQEAARGRRRVWYASYKERMKAEKLKEAAWQEKRKTMSKRHLEYLDEAQKNREIAAARYDTRV